jgi:dimethylhistidine N-methyltransferase
MAPHAIDSRASVAAELADARVATLALLEPLSDADLVRQWSPLQSPLVWDLAHVGHFEDVWIAQRIGGLPPLLAEGEDLYDAFRHARNGRGELPLLDPAAARDYLARVRDRTVRVVAEASLDGDDPLLAGGFVFGLVVQHERQHVETMLQTIALSGLPHAGGSPGQVTGDGETLVEAGPFELGTDDAWAYDNERPAHTGELPDFLIDTAPVTNADWRRFVDDGGYARRELWSEEGWAWREAEGIEAPLGWSDGAVRRFGRDEPLDPREPVQHVSFHEAEAFARWAGKRLPTEQEWEKAAKAGVLGDVGRVWEWTSSALAGYPGFAAFPYAEYSEVFFGDEYRVLRGGSWATHPSVARLSFRNWDYPIRRQIFAGLRLARDADSGVVTLLGPEDRRRALERDVREGLAETPRRIPPKWHYDEEGSRLFDEITRLPEYYLTRREREILAAQAGEVASVSGADTLVELGAGTSEKTRILLDALRAAGQLRRIVLLDVDEATLRASVERLRADYPEADVRGIVGDLERHLGDLPREGRRLVCFLGSSIGNFDVERRPSFLRALREAMAPGESFLLGVDLVKDPARLAAAYDDAAGVTARFSLNLLSVLNDELGADFDPARFEHVPRWDSERELMDIRLRSLGPQRVRIPALGLEVDLAEGEELHTEVSAKFRRETLEAELRAAGFEPRAWWTDEAGDFGLSLSAAVS